MDLPSNQHSFSKQGSNMFFVNFDIIQDPFTSSEPGPPPTQNLQTQGPNHSPFQASHHHLTRAFSPHGHGPRSRPPCRCARPCRTSPGPGAAPPWRGTAPGRRTRSVCGAERSARERSALGGVLWEARKGWGWRAHGHDMGGASLGDEGLEHAGWYSCMGNVGVGCGDSGF